jgi:lipopolysaccharide/colanic/teichoic acid biosynthesis glycosyltransferase
MTRAKRTLDLIGAGAGAVLLSPLFFLIALLVKVGDGGPVFFRQERVGFRGRPFRIWKFRTMIPGAELRGLPLTIGKDARVTRVGAWLRRLRLDELPQLFNVLAGDMTLVGPRPEVPRYVEFYDSEQRRVLDLVPGLTDEASIRYLDESAMLGAAADPEQMYVDQIIPEKIRLSLKYATRATMWTDLRVMLVTARRLFQSSHATRHPKETDVAACSLASRSHAMTRIWYRGDGPERRPSRGLSRRRHG